MCSFFLFQYIYITQSVCNNTLSLQEYCFWTFNTRSFTNSALFLKKKAFNQFTIACELDMKNAISAADIAFIMSSSTSAWLLSPLECSPQKQNG